MTTPPARDADRGSTSEPGSTFESGGGAGADGATRPRLRPIGRVFAVVAFVEAFTWAGLLVGMFLKYVTGTTEAGVWLFGRLHGGAFMVYVGVAIVAAISLRWRWWVTLTALLAAIPPLTTVPLEIWLRRTGRLSARPRMLAAEAAERPPSQVPQSASGP